MQNSTFFVVLVALVGGDRAQSADYPAGANAVPAARGYASPREAFNAARAATAKRDWRTVFLAFTPAAQDARVVEVFWRCIYHEDSKVRPVMKKYGLETDKVMSQYNKEYKRKYGVDLDKLQAEADKRSKERFDRHLKSHPEIAKAKSDVAVPVPYEPGEAPEPSPPPFDSEMLSRVVLGLVSDKAAFYAEASEATVSKVKDVAEPDYGDLHGLTVSGNSAAGWVTVTTYCLHMRPGKPDAREPNPPHREQHCFCKLNGRWYVAGPPIPEEGTPAYPSVRSDGPAQ